MAARRKTARGAAVVAGLVLASCTADAEIPSEPSAGRGELPTVDVVTGDVTSVLVVDGVTISRPQVAVSAHRSGVLNYQVEDGAFVLAGDVIGQVAGDDVAAPVAGVLNRWLVPDGAEVGRDVPVAILGYGGMGIAFVAPAEQAYRLYAVPTEATAAIDGGPAGISCQVELDASSPAIGAATGELSLTPSDEMVVGELRPAPPWVCLLPDDTATLPGLGAKLGLETAHREQVLTLPVEAVLGHSDSGAVTRVVGDAYEDVQVDLGVSDGAVVEITSGLDEGDRVLAYAPGLGR